MKTKLEVGQKIFIQSLDNRRGADTELKECTVTKVGKKYFEVDSFYMGRFFLDTLFQDGKGYSAGYRAYLTRQDYEDEQEATKLVDELRKVFGGYGRPKFSLYQLQRIKAIVDEK